MSYKIYFRSYSVDGDCVPCEFKNLKLNPNAGFMISKNINAKLRTQRALARTSIEQSEVEQLSSYERKMAYFIRFHLRDILTSDHRHVWFCIETKSLEEIEDRSQMSERAQEEISVVYSFGSMFSYDTFIGHVDDRCLARIRVLKHPKAIQLETASHCLTMWLKNIDSQILINHSTNDNSIQVIFMLKSPPNIKHVSREVYRAQDRLVEEIPKCSDLLLRFFPASRAWRFLRELPIAGYTRTASSHFFHINFALFHWQKDPSNLLLMGEPSYSFTVEAYAMEMLWSLGYLYQDKYNADCQVLNGKRDRNFYDLSCIIWRNLKANHCYRMRDVFTERRLTNSNGANFHGASQQAEVAFAILTPFRLEYQPMRTIGRHRGFDHYDPENWLLVHIRDHNGTDRLYDLDLQTMVRFRNLMLKGISRGGRKYQYFGSSNSQRKDQAGWFLCVPRGETIEKAREKLGNFSEILNVSTYHSRLGLYLTTAKSAEIELKNKGKAKNTDGEPFLKRKSSIFSSLGMVVRKLVYGTKKEPLEYMAIVIDDEKRNDYCFTDGCGKISRALAKKVALNIGMSIADEYDVPSAFQVRIAGCKGMLSIDPKSKSNEYYILVRQSMIKFESNDWTLYIVDHSRPMPLSLNNEVIRLLSDLGNSHGTFESIQTRCIDRKEFWHPPPSSYLNAMDSLDQSVIESKRQKYKNAKHFLHRNKIPLPLNDGRLLFGIADETGQLKEGECFIQYRDLEHWPRAKKYEIALGTVIVTKNPCLHPGDVRKLRAVMVEELEPYVRDCIVFSTAGSRPSFNEMAGSDLDGDQYWVYWGHELRVDQVVPPLLYPSPKKTTKKPVTDELIVDHVLNSLTKGDVGKIANTHKVIADKHPRGTLSKECEECASLFARAIDASKTGERIPMQRIEELREQYGQTYPEWMMKFYKPVMDPPSKSVNEILFRRAQDAWLHDDCYQDILRPLHGVESNDAPTMIDIEDSAPIEEEEEDQAGNRCRCLMSCLCILIAIVVFVVWVLSQKKK